MNGFPNNQSRQHEHAIIYDVAGVGRIFTALGSVDAFIYDHNHLGVTLAIATGGLQYFYGRRKPE